MEKLVPAIIEEGRVLTGFPESLIRAIHSMSLPFYPYGIRFGNSGMIGASPEPIVSIEGDSLSTIALAGTASNNPHLTLHRDKEQREHQYVADFIASRLRTLGRTRRSSVGQLDLGSMRHLITSFETQLASEPDIDQVLDTLHPTPAVGPWPRTTRTLQMAVSLRDMAGVPRAFGAPFGVAHDNEFHALLTIRNVIWKGNRIVLPAGCGIIQCSDVDEEWEELRFKRDSVKEFLGINSHQELFPRALSA
ncbi:MAG: menaquinone-specific isochorismate synthase [Verrucomicrobiales bacterium]